MMNKWFFRLLFSYLPLFIIVLALIFTSFLLSFSEKNKKEIETVSEYINQSVMQTVDNSLKSIFRRTSNELNTNNVIMRFFELSSSQDNIIHYNVMAKLQEIKDAYPLIESLYVVRNSDHTVITENYITDVTQYGDELYINELLERPYYSGWTGIRENFASEMGDEHSIISLIRRGNPQTQDAGILVVNISAHNLRILVEELVGSNYPYVQIRDDNDQDIAGSSSTGQHEDTLTRLQSKYTGWTYEIRWQDQRAPFIYDTIPLLWILVMIIASLAGIIGVVYITYRNYRPVKAITSLITEFTLKASFGIADNPNEIKYIENAMHSLIDKTLENQKLFEVSKQTMQLEFFRDLLDGDKSTLKSWNLPHNPFSEVLPQSYYVVMVMEIDRYNEFQKSYSQRDQELLKFVLRNMVHEIFQEHQKYCWAEWTDSRQMTCIVASSASMDPSDAYRKAYASILSWVYENLHYTITIGIGNMVDRNENIHQSRASALIALKYKMVLGLNRIIINADYKHAETISLMSYYAQTKSIAAAFRSSQESWKEQLSALFNDMRMKMIDNDSFSQVMQYFNIQIEQEMSALANSYREGWESLREAYKLTDIENINEAEIAIFEVMNNIASNISAIRDTRMYRIQLADIRKYVELNYGDQQLSLDQLSSHFSLNSKYISELFKDEFGVNFLDYVIGLRVKYACKLLEETDQPIQDIAELCGYMSSIAFRRTFKKIIGETPGEYRQRRRG